MSLLARVEFVAKNKLNYGGRDYKAGDPVELIGARNDQALVDSGVLQMRHRWLCEACGEEFGELKGRLLHKCRPTIEEEKPTVKRKAKQGTTQG